jgi:hypothetical protein
LTATDAGSTPEAPAVESTVEQRDTYWVTIDLSSRIAPDHFPTFRTFENVPALATVRSVVPAAELIVDGPSIGLITAEVREGFLLISVQVSATLVDDGRRRTDSPAILNRLEVAWAVDTQEPSA